MNKTFAGRRVLPVVHESGSAQGIFQTLTVSKMWLRITGYMTREQIYTHLVHFLLSIGAVMATAALQAAITYASQLHPDLFAGVSQTATAFAAIKLLGR